MGIKNKNIMYVGDHIVGDTGAGREQQMRTMLIISEIKPEIQTLMKNRGKYAELAKLEKEEAEIYQKYNSQIEYRDCTEMPQELIQKQN